MCLKVITTMAITTSFAQVHEFPQSHCGDNRESTMFSQLYTYIHIYMYVCVCVCMCVCVYIYIDIKIDRYM